MKIKHTYNKGMNQDLSPLKVGPDTYYSASNFRLLTDEGSSSFSLVNEKGNKLLITIPDITNNSYSGTIGGFPSTVVFTAPQTYTESNLEIIGHCVLRNYILLFTTNVNTSTGGTGQIWKLEYNPSTLAIQTLQLVYINSDLNFSKQYPIIDTVGRYENSEVQKVYWTDNFNLLRSINVEYNGNLFNVPVGVLEVSPSITFSEPLLINMFNGGEYNAGSVQYGYSLYTINGGQSKISPLSNIYPISEKDYKGALQGTNTGQAIEVQISNIDLDYTHIQVYSLFYQTENDIPTIYLIQDTEIPDTGVFSFVDDGINNISTITQEEFLLLGGDPLICKTIDTKDNVLFPANIRRPNFNVDFDTRAYRFNSSRIAEIRDSQGNIEASINALPSPSWPNNTTEAEFDAINPGSPNDLARNYNYKYKSDGQTLGGEGPNIEYNFGITQILGDKDKTSMELHRVTDTGVISNVPNNNKLKNYTSPFVSGELKGLRRDETYRVGLVWYNNKGQESFVNWIGDIRTPSIEEINGTNSTYSDGSGALKFDHSLATGGTGNETELNVLTLTVIVKNLTSQIVTDNNLEGFKIVYVERERKDKTILSQGIVNTTLWNPFDLDGIANSDAHNAFWFTNSIAQFDPNELNGAGGDNAFGYMNKAGFQTKANVIKFTSPEHSFFRDLDYRTGNYFVSCASLERNSQSTIVGKQGATTVQSSTFGTLSISTPGGPLPDPLNDLFSFHIQKGIETHALVGSSINKQIVSDAKKADISFSEIYMVGGNKYRNYTNINNNDLASKQRMNYSNSSLICSISPNNIVPNEYEKPSVLSSTNGLLLSNYKQEVIKQYGGGSFSERTNNKYTSFSKFVPVNSSTSSYSTVTNGDTYVNYFSVVTSILDNELGDNEFNAGSCCEILMIPIESSFNVDMRADINYSNKSWGNITLDDNSVISNAFSLQETLSQGTTLFPANYVLKVPNLPALAGTSTHVIEYEPDLTDQYLYNKSYSRTDIKSFFPKPFNFSSVEINDVLVVHSDKKANNEIIDSWTKFRPNNEIEVDSKHGSITRVRELQDELYFVQENAFGHLLVNPRTQIVTNNVIAELGTGKTLEDYRYYSTKRGSVHQPSIVTSAYSLYFVDANRQKIVRFNSQGTRDLSDIDGLHGKLKEILSGDILVNDNTLLDKGVVSIYNPEFNEVLFTFLNDTKKETLAYNENINSFTGSYDYTPSNYISDSYNILSTSSNLKSVYIHNEGDYGEYYGNTPSYSSIIFTFNGQIDVSKTVDNLYWISQLFDSTGTNVFNETLTDIRVYNEYQDTGYIPSANFIRRMRGWRYIVKRDINSTNQRARIRAPYHFIELRFLNNNNKKFNLSDIELSYRASKD